MSNISETIGDYLSINFRSFERKLRLAIVRAARDLSRSGLAFATYDNSRCNPVFWDRTEQGGFLLKKGVPPFDAIKDIYVHGSSYATECSTAIPIIFYKALVDLFPAGLFNELFANLYLYDWKVDRDLGVHVEVPSQYLPGDCRYFDNPDFNPDTPQWQGENVIDLGDGTYYGHGMGIAVPEKFIMVLNSLRKIGAGRSAYLTDEATRPDFKYLSDRYYGYTGLVYRVRMVNGASAFSH
ncbi:MAG: protein-glutamine gamma-glutamyltransferase [Firmicutes bacterium]|nr:protein-glutamine gamma-glutamyltransferase [Bacillota bacterium]